MKKLAIAAATVAAALLVAGFAYTAYAAGTRSGHAMGIEDGHHAQAAGHHGLVAIVAEVTGLGVDEVRDQRLDGKSLAAIVQDAGGDLDAVLAKAVAQHEAMHQGQLTEAQADATRAQMTAHLTAALNSTGPVDQCGMGHEVGASHPAHGMHAGQNMGPSGHNGPMGLGDHMGRGFGPAS